MPPLLLSDFWQKPSRKLAVWSVKGCHSVTDHWQQLSLGMSNMSSCWFDVDDVLIVDAWWIIATFIILYQCLANGTLCEGSYRPCDEFSLVLSSLLPSLGLSMPHPRNCRVLLWQDHRNGTSSAKSENFLRRFVEVEKLRRLTRGLFRTISGLDEQLKCHVCWINAWILIYLSISASM